MITTTLNRIVQADWLAEGRKTRLLKGLGKKRADDEPLPFSRIVEVDGLETAILCFAAEPQYAREMKSFAVWCARRVQRLMTDPDSITALDVAERYARGEATLDELERAIDAAASAASAAESESEHYIEAAAGMAELWLAASARREWGRSWKAWEVAARADAARPAAGAARAVWAGAVGWTLDSAWNRAAAAAWAARSARVALPTELAAQTAEFLRIVNETEART